MGLSFSGATPDTATAEPIANDGWFPDVDPSQVAAEQRIGSGVTPPRLRAAVVAAIITVGNELLRWQATHRAEGHVSLAAVPSPRIDGRSRLEILYLRAVGAYAKADLVERYRDVDTTAAGQRRADDLDISIGELRRDAIHAIRDMLGRTRTDVELI